MKTITPNLILLFLFSFILFSCTKEDSNDYTSENIKIVDIKVSYSPLELEIANLIQAHRESLGLASLDVLNIVSGVAEGHTTYMIEAGRISHDNFEQRVLALINYVGAKSVGENVAYGYSTAEAAVNGWLNNEEHRKIIENPDFTHFGISTGVNSENKNYFTQIFIKK